MPDKYPQRERLAPENTVREETGKLLQQKSARLLQQDHDMREKPAGSTPPEVLSRTGLEQPLSILVADDNEVNRTVQFAQLEILGYRADMVTNGEEVLQALHANRYDVLLLDILMPVLDGIDTSKRIRKMEVNRQPYIIAVTASDFSRDSQRFASAGINDYLAKPVILNDLASALSNAFVTIYNQEPSQVATPAPATSGKPVLQLEELRCRLGTTADELLRRVIPVFVKEMPGRQCTLREAHSSMDRVRFGRLCHNLKGSCLSIGAYPLASECEKMEQLCDNHNLPSADELEAFISLSDSTVQALSQELHQLCGSIYELR